MHIYPAGTGAPVVTILRPACTPKGTEVRTVVKHVTRRLRQHWLGSTRIVWRHAEGVRGTTRQSLWTWPEAMSG